MIKKRDKFDLKWIIFIIIPLIVSIYCFYQNFSYNGTNAIIDLWILPLLYSICQIVTYKHIDKSKKIGAWAVNITSFIRYVVAILLYYSDYNSNKILYMESKTTITMLMGFEMIMIYFFIFFYLKTHKEISQNTVKYENYSFSRLSIIILVIFYIGIVMVYPNIFMDSKSIGLTGTFGTLVKLLFNYGSIIIILLLLKSIKKLKINDFMKIIISLFISLIFTISFSVNGDNVSRWSIVVNIIIFVDIIKKYYNNNTKFINTLLVTLLFCVLIISTVYKFERNKLENSNVSIDYIVNRYFTFKSLDAYFSGPYQVYNAINTRKDFGNSITINTFINDIFANCPIISNFVNQSDTTPYWYNLEYYKLDWVQDKICPMIGQGYLYFWIAAPILSIIAVWLSLSFSYKMLRSKNEIENYIYGYLAIVFGIYMCSNMNIIFQSIWINILPLYLVYKIKINVRKKE